jgi:SAGA-associated factor 29
MDVEPDEATKQREYRTSASNMIPVMPESQAHLLSVWETGRIVLALYPNTTTFYKAEVMSTPVDGKVKLKFDGETDSDRVLEVERRFVVEYRP